MPGIQLDPIKMAVVGVAVVVSTSTVLAKPQATAEDHTPAASRFEDCGASPLQARLDAAAKTIFVKDNAVDNAVLKCLNQWGDRNKVRVVLEPVIE